MLGSPSEVERRRKAELRARFPGFWCPDNHLRRSCGHAFPGFGARITTWGGAAGRVCRVLVPGKPPGAELRARFAGFGAGQPPEAELRARFAGFGARQPPEAELRARFTGFWCRDNHLGQSHGHVLPGFGAGITTWGGAGARFAGFGAG